MNSGLPACFESGGLPNTAVAQIPLATSDTPKEVFDRLVEEIWRKTTLDSAVAAEKRER